jgi:uncharacterized membrane protein YcaP (DUF421 family)
MLLALVLGCICFTPAFYPQISQMKMLLALVLGCICITPAFYPQISQMKMLLALVLGCICTTPAFYPRPHLYLWHPLSAHPDGRDSL